MNKLTQLLTLSLAALLIVGCAPKNEGIEHGKRIERRADQEARLGRATEALRLYKEAMPGLPAVRQAIVTDKIKTMQREALIQAGDEAMAARKWSEAISAFEQANAMQYDPELSRKIIRVRNLASADGK